jgi:dihydroorotate dehydrogenase (fumarate)
MERGVGHLSRMLADLETWMQVHEYVSVEQMRGSMSYRRVPNPSAYERANYMKELQSYRPDPASLR